MSSIPKYIVETSWALAAKAAAFLFYYSLLFYLTRVMDVSAWGNWSAFFALLNILMLASDQGINSASKRYIARARGLADVGGVIRTTFILRFSASVIYVVVVAIIFRPLLGLLHQTEYTALLQRSLLLIAVYGMADYFKALFEALHQLRFTFVVTAVEHGLRLVCAVLLFRGGRDFTPIVAAFTIATILAAVTGVLLAARTVPKIWKAAAPAGLIREAYSYSLPIFLMSIGALIALDIDTIMLKRLRNDYETGLYSAAKNLVMFLPHLSLAISMGVIPGLAVFDRASAPATRRTYYRVLSAIVGVYLVIILAIVAVALFGMPIFFRAEYAAASVPLLLLAPFVALGGITVYCGTLLDYRGKAWARSTNFGIAIFLNILLNWWWIPRWGAAGAAAASSIAFVPYCALNLWQADRAFYQTD